MTRALRVVDSARVDDVFEALRDALGGGGPAVVPREGGGGRRVGGRVDVGRFDGGRLDDGRVDRVWPGENERVGQNVALVIETSGSTGVPKRVALSADALLASAAASAGAMGGQGQWMLALPAHYVAGAQVLVRSIAAETEPVLYGDGHFDPGRFAEVARDLTHDLRFVSLVPVQLARLVAATEAGDRVVADALRRFDGILVGGQALTTELRERALDAGARILSTYGSSETAGGCVYDGRPIGTTAVRSVDGLLEIAGPVLAEGYLGDPDRTAAAFHEADGQKWYRTGDLGAVDGGLVRVFGRADNVIISGGEKVLLDAVEGAVRALDGFGGAVVVAADDAEWGQVPVVVVESGGAAAATELAAVRAHVAEQVGRAAAPAEVVEVDVLPHLSSGKPDRVAARRIAESARGERARRG
ncbi:AMP-binding protein [Leifsonia sp. NCR5]|uniref:AMP-binding protein n=1 Tax=Leifsonia sp. NCR5 TaxID=1978342 RepID=UPI00211A5867|nr:AMP-binding protein [Leifsonia sp. NCR5]